VPLWFLLIGIVAVGLAAGLPSVLEASGRQAPLKAYAVVMTATMAAVVWGLWVVVRQSLIQAAGTLANEARMVAFGSAGAGVPLHRYADLAPLPQAVNELVDKLVATRRDIDRAVASTTTRIEEQNSRLSAILRDLHEGVLVCNLQHQVLLYNQTALNLLQVTGEIGIGRNLLHLVLAEPVLHTLERLTLRVREGRHGAHADRATAQFVGGTIDGSALLQGRMSLILQDSDGDEGTVGAITGYVVTFTEATRELAALGQRDALLRAATEDVRAPLANLRAMLETLCEAPEIDPESRAHFEGAMLAECTALTRRIEHISEKYRGIVSGTWPMSDIHTNNLFNLVVHRVVSHTPFSAIPTGLAHWLHGDSYSLVILLDFLIERLHESTGIGSFDLSSEVSGRFVYIDISWLGAPAASSLIDRWKAQALPAALGGLTVGDVLLHHRSELWSEAGRPGYARLRLPLPPAQRLLTEPVIRRATAPRAEFFDFSLLVQPLATGGLHQCLLDDLTYVVFDSETTGLQPSEGDEIISIAAVRIVNHRILTGETFSALVNPRRSIPAESIPVHGITDEMVADQPTLDVILPQFRAFVADAVLVAHNAAFDLKFLKMKERACGVRFDNPVLDTMLLSMQLQGAGGDHSLDGISARLGIEVVDRHSALGDSLTTAAVFLAMLDMLKERNILTLEEAIREANILVELHARERMF
jgi:DNA polymerase-3 subunit epsilon